MVAARCRTARWRRRRGQRGGRGSPAPGELEAAPRRARWRKRPEIRWHPRRAASPEKGEPPRGASRTATAHPTGGPDGPAPDNGEVSQEGHNNDRPEAGKGSGWAEPRGEGCGCARAIAVLGCGQDEVQVTVDSTGTETVEAPQQRAGEANPFAGAAHRQRLREPNPSRPGLDKTRATSRTSTCAGLPPNGLRWRGQRGHQARLSSPSRSSLALRWPMSKC